MALQFVPQSPAQPTATRPTAQAALIAKHRAMFAAVLAQIPAAVEARRRSRSARPAPPPTVFILDWDDTCCATSSLEQAGFMADLDSRIEECAPEQARYLRVLESRVLSLLKTAVELGTVLIVTNAGDGWVELSSSRFLPAVREFLDANYKRIKVISARARYVDEYREYPLQWKAKTFADELKAIYELKPMSSQPLHAVVLGDSVGDQYAAHVAAHELEGRGMPVVLKVVKFLERPTIDQLCKELSVLLDHIVAMTTHLGPFDVSMYNEGVPPHQHHHHAQQLAAQHLAAQQLAAQQQHSQVQAASGEARPAQTLQQSTSLSNSVDAQHSAMTAVSTMAACSAAV